ncbi:Pentatricopeptide repeat-containing protein [Camellia lanceoleosa]|uniref:Pentatricopeptide repeat-containing protein n=1 Tax=Camellia lanceoleosa TaxID=1840588 RepID=A0ACC0FH42_9ERIC|nr:Pentatricopeptide repeat-containing protein [Camellia lanceoleosa]
MRIQNLKSLLTLIETCRNLPHLKQIHARSIILGLTYNQFILTKLVSSFLSIPCLDYATGLFDRTHELDVFIWNAMIKGYSSSQSPIMAILMYNKMRVSENVVADNYTYPFVFRACANVFAVEKGREVHGIVVRIGFDSDRFLQSSLLNLYTVCGEIRSARKVFDEFEGKDVVFWNAMILGYSREGMVFEALEVFEEMIEMGEVKPNEGTILSLISVSMVLKDLKMGREIQGYIKKEIDLSKGVKLGAALIDLYSKCGRLDDARKLFDEMPEKNAVVWNSLICGYSKAGSLHEAIDLFREMYNSNVKPDRFTISALLGACAQTGAFNLGNWVWKFAENSGIWDTHIGTSLIDMYAKCGFILMAREVFDQIPKRERTVATWNAIISGYASHGHAEPVIELFNEMKRLETRPDSITFLAVLHACAHAGLVEKGKQYFDSMKYYKITPTVEHYGCMVDLLGRAGLVNEAKELIMRMEIEPNATVWGALLSACSIHGNVEIGEWVAHHIFKLDAMDGGSYVLLGNLYAAARRFNGVKAVREMMVKRGICKPPGCSMIEIDDVVHEFLVADKLHCRSLEIYTVLDELSMKLKIAGYVPMVVVLDEEGFI